MYSHMHFFGRPFSNTVNEAMKLLTREYNVVIMKGKTDSFLVIFDTIFMVCLRKLVAKPENAKGRSQVARSN